MTKELWTVGQAAEAMGCSENTVRRLISSGQLPCINLSVRLTRIDPEDVAVYIESRKHRAEQLRARQRRSRLAAEPRRGGLNNSGYTPGMKVV